MDQPHSGPNREFVVDTMIELTRLSNLHRAILAGSDSLALYLALRRRGFIRVSTTETCRIPMGQHSIGLITGQNSLAAIEAALTRISPFLCTTAAIAVLINFRESGFCLRNPDQTGTDGLSNRGGCQVPAGPCAIGIPTEFWPDGKSGVKSDDPAKAEIAGAIGRDRQRRPGMRERDLVRLPCRQPPPVSS